MRKARNKCSTEIRTRAVRLVLDQGAEHSSRWSAIQAIAPKIGCSAQTLNEEIKRVEVGAGRRGDVPTELAETVSSARHRPERRWRAALERENRELRHAKEILRKASAYSAQDFRRSGIASSDA
ncbi:MAG: hypothetical protein AAF074_14420 [Pseudomonadota bacterium]